MIEMSCTDPEGGGDRGSGPPPPPKNHKNIVFFNNADRDPDPLENHKATKPAFDFGS